MEKSLMEFIGHIVLLVVQWAIYLPLSFLFSYAWNHSLVELWPAVVPTITFWQAYLLIVVAGFLLPVKFQIIQHKE